MLAGGVTQFLSEGGVLLIGGIACIVLTWLASCLQPGFVAYDAKHPVP
jgi:ENTS family enterobactin (siderophore) exporter